MELIVNNNNYLDKLKDIKLKDKCNYKIIIKDLSKRSTDMSTRFNAHLTYFWQWFNFQSADRFLSREEAKQRILLKAASYKEDDLFNGMKPWPMINVKIKNQLGELDNAICPSLSTSDKNNGQMLTAYQALCEIAREQGCDLPENI